MTPRKVLGVPLPSQPPPRSDRAVLSEEEYSLLWQIHEDAQATKRELAEVVERVDEHDEILITLRKERLAEAERGARVEDSVGQILANQSTQNAMLARMTGTDLQHTQDIDALKAEMSKLAHTSGAAAGSAAGTEAGHKAGSKAGTKAMVASPLLAGIVWIIVEVVKRLVE